MRRSASFSRNFTEGSILKKLLLFALPFMASNALQVFYALVDMVIVGNFVGSYGLSAVSVASQITTFSTMLCLGFSTGGQVYIAQLTGVGQKERINRTIGTMFASLALLAGVFTLTILILRTPILQLMHTPPESFSMALDYLTICGVGTVFTFGYNIVSAVLRGMGDSRHPFLFILIASVVNLLLDIVFTGGLGWGVSGAATATIIGQGVSFLFAILYLYKNRGAFGFDFRRDSFKIQPDILKTLSGLGIPFAIQSCAINISMIFVNSLVNQAGVHASAAFGVGVKLDDIVTKVSQGIMHAASPMIGQNFAAGKRDRIKKIVKWTFLITAAMYTVFVLIYIPFCKEMFGLFTHAPEVIALAPVFVSAIVWSFPGLAVMRAMGSFVQGIGNAKLMMVLGILDGFAARILLSYTIGIVLGLGLYGFILGYGLACYAFAIPASLYFFSGVWKNRRSLVERKCEEKG